jgi:two-component SAPR family response regulator
MPMEPKATIRIFGRFKVIAGNGTEVKWRISKAEELMAYLNHHQGENVDRYRIMNALWGNDSKRTAAYFNTTVHYLRKNLLSAGITDLLLHHRGHYRIEVHQLKSDDMDFIAFLSNSDPVHSGNIDLCESMAKLYAGGYLADNDYGWAVQTRVTLENEYIALLLRMNDYYGQMRLYPSAIKVLKKALKHTPWNETIHTKLISSHLAANDHLSAMKQYDALKRSLKREFQLEPNDEIKSLLSFRRNDIIRHNKRY